MNITGIVIIELSGYVDAGVLYVGDAAVYDVSHVLGDGTSRYVVCIGEAEWVRWDPRFAHMLLNAESIEITGTRAGGVAQATEALHVAVMQEWDAA